ncbi:YncE family protein [Methylobrevis pamukkalensis]|uniref:Virginiamycin B lyase n=1 Tax=Methylobrevis pamukkalensis TaxID=1439726 RepID=A0A1E3H636_9HYPH|nr:YncE family protein [Methylobrevis pamukkalensis]ODN71799.1 Virginiamycin B lyase [Methylobrevis pamukkalensis]
MRRRAAALAGLCLLAASLQAPGPSLAAGEDIGEILVVSQGAATLTRLPADGSPRLLALARAPAGIAVDAAGRVAAVSHPELGQVSLIDLGEDTVSDGLDIGGQPFGIAFTEEGRLLVTDWSRDLLVRLDPATGEAEELAVGTAPSAVVVDAARGIAYTVDRESDRVSRVDLAGFSVTGTAGVGRAPFAAALSADGAWLHVANVQSGDVSIVDTASMTEVARVAIGGMPYGVAVDPATGLVLVTDQEGGRLVMVDPQARRVRGEVRVGDYPEAVAVTGDGRAHVANWFSDTVATVDLATLKVESTEVAAGPRMLAVLRGAAGRAATNGWTATDKGRGNGQ